MVIVREDSVDSIAPTSQSIHRYIHCVIGNGADIPSLFDHLLNVHVCLLLRAVNVQIALSEDEQQSTERAVVNRSCAPHHVILRQSHRRVVAHARVLIRPLADLRQHRLHGRDEDSLRRHR